MTMMTFKDELKHVMPAMDDMGKYIVVCGPEEFKDFFLDLCRIKSVASVPTFRAGLDVRDQADDTAVGEAFYRKWIARPDDEVACVKRINPDNTPYACHVYARTEIPTVVTRMTVGRRTNTEVIRRALYDIGVTRMITFMDTEEGSHCDTLRDRGWTFEKLQSGRFRCTFVMEDRP